MNTRRSFLKTGTAGALAKAGPRRRPIFDAHLHCPSADGQVWQWHRVTRDFDDFVVYLARTGVERGVINDVRSQDAKDAAGFIAGNREVARLAEKHKGRLQPACIVNPPYIDESLREMEECRKQLGMLWIAELCNYVTPYEYSIKQFALLVEQAIRLRMVLHLHTEGDEMHYIMKKFPAATGPVCAPRRRQGIRACLPAHRPGGSTSKLLSGYRHDRVGVLEYAVQQIGPDRILFGSDFSINDPGSVIARIDNALITPEQKKKILWRNLEALLAKVGAQ